MKAIPGGATSSSVALSSGGVLPTPVPAAPGPRVAGSNGAILAVAAGAPPAGWRRLFMSAGLAGGKRRGSRPLEPLPRRPLGRNDAARRTISAVPCGRHFASGPSPQATEPQVQLSPVGGRLSGPPARHRGNVRFGTPYIPGSHPPCPCNRGTCRKRRSAVPSCNHPWFLSGSVDSDAREAAGWITAIIDTVQDVSRHARRRRIPPRRGVPSPRADPAAARSRRRLTTALRAPLGR